jgi:protein-S-isoprenylcysteine O-methyltransferase Ste14
MIGKNLASLFRVLLLLAVAGTINMLLLCAPVLLFSGAQRIGSDPHITIFLFLTNGWCFAEIVVSSLHSRPAMSGTPQRWLAPAIGVAILVVFWVSIAEIALGAPTRFGIDAGVGVILLVVGGALRCVSIHTLGPYFLNEISLLPGQPLVTQGVYGLLRHPSELGTLCLAFGGAIVLHSLVGLIICTVVLLPCVIMRIRLEDTVLRSCHAGAFSKYAREVPALLPLARLARRAT